jgi:hypothetical protein
MTYRVIFLALAACWLSPPMATAQQSATPILKDNGVYAVQFVNSGTVIDTKAMWEDVEIFRRILDRSVAGWAESSTTAGQLLSSIAFSPDGKRWAETDIDGTVRLTDDPSVAYTTWFWGLKGPKRFSVEGNYLKGYGAVFTATVPWDARNPVAESAKSEPKALSEWDRVRKELRGEKLEPAPTKGHTGTSLADIVINVLADNGRHFSQLGENERVTVAITLRPATSSGLSANRDSVWRDLRTAPGGDGKVLRRDLETGNLYAPVLTDIANVGELFRVPRDQKQDQDKAARTEAANFVHLGDQRLKQERFQEAADAYEKAITAYNKIVEQRKKPGTLAGQLVDDLAALTIARSKLASVYFSLKRDPEARKLLSQVARDYELITGKPAPQVPADSAKKVRTGKLIVSAPKRLLDQVGTGKLSPEDFKNQASIDFYAWDAPGKEPVKPTGDKAAAPAEKKQ